MSNYKVKVNNEVESREVQGLFEQFGGKHHGADFSRVGLVVLVNNIIYIDFVAHEMYYTNKYKCEEITIPQLKDLVVLKRNDKSDRNVIDPKEDANLYLDSDNKLFVFHLPTQKWKESNLNGEEEVMERLKPISPLKEYLVPQGNGKYALTKATEKRVSDWVEIAEPWMDFVYQMPDGEFRYSDVLDEFKAEFIVWQRHTKPEELPFADDEPKSLNNTYAEIEQVRHNHYFKDVSDINQIDVYEVLKRFNVTDPCLQHIVKKALCAGQRGHKDFKNDLRDILDTAKRAVEINS